MNNVRGKMIGIMIIFIVNSITIFLKSPEIISFILNFIPNGINILAMSPAEVLTITITLSALFSFLIVMPIVIYYIFGYINDALYPNEKTVLKSILFFGTMLFMIGFVVSFFAFTSGGLPWLAKFNTAHGIETLWSLSDTIYILLSIGFTAGITFELPMVLYYLIKHGLVEFKMNKGNRAMMLLGLAILFAVITPDGSGVTQLGLMLPIYGLVEISVYFGNRNKLKEVKK